MLDALDDAVIAVNESEEIRFCNSACESLLRHPADDLRGRLIWSIFRANRTAEVLRPFLCCLEGAEPGADGKQRVFRIGLEGRDGIRLFANVQVAPVVSERSRYYLFILKRPGSASGFVWRRCGGSPVNHVDEALAAIRERLKGLDDILPGMLPEACDKTGEILFCLSEINRFFSRLNLLLQRPAADGNELRFLGVQVMNLSVEYWLNSGGTDKFDLARRSKLWTVYTNPDGWERTQTLDKYFALSTFPKRPNWHKVLATAEFVLNRCLAPSPLRESLERFLEQLHFSLAGGPR